MLKAERSTPFNDLLKLARESKQTVVGNEFHTFTTPFAKKVLTNLVIDTAIWRLTR